MSQLSAKEIEALYQAVGKYVRLSFGNSPAAADMESLVPFAVIEAIRSFDPERGASLQSYACSVAFKRCADLYGAKRRRWPVYYGNAPTLALDTAIAPQNGTDGILLPCVIRCLAKLRKQDRQVLQLYYLQDFTMEEIAKKRGISRQRVQQQLRYAEMNLRQAVAADRLARKRLQANQKSALLAENGRKSRTNRPPAHLRGVGQRGPSDHGGGLAGV